MQLRWTEEAASDLTRIADYLFEHAPERAENLIRTVYDAPSSLLPFPARGRPGKKEGVVRILHGAQQWSECPVSLPSTLPSSAPLLKRPDWGSFLSRYFIPQRSRNLPSL
jgi:plasmid stabilization system protein ParE